MPLLSVVIVGRNDGYMGDYLYRLGTTLSVWGVSAATSGRPDEVEFVVVDWGSERPLAEHLNLASAARERTRFVEVPVEMARGGRDGLGIHATLAVNVGVRRACGTYVLFTDSDCLWSGPAVRHLLDALAGDLPLPVARERAFYYVRRYQIPRALVATQPSPEEWVRRLPRLVAGVRPESPSASCLGGFSAGQLAHRDLWHEARGYNEQLDRAWGWADNDLMLRLTSRYDWVDLGSVGVFAMHMEHAAPSTTSPRPVAAVNRMTIAPFIEANDEAWGLAAQSFRERPADPRPSGTAPAPSPPPDAVPSLDHVVDARSAAVGVALRAPEERAIYRGLASICRTARARRVLWCGRPDPLALSLIVDANPAVDLVLASLWGPGDVPPEDPLNPGEFSRLLEVMQYRGFGRCLLGDAATVARSVAVLSRAEPFDLVCFGDECPDEVREIAGQLAGAVSSWHRRGAPRQMGEAAPTVEAVESRDRARPDEVLAGVMRHLLARIANDLRPDPIDPASLDWDGPVLVLRSAHMGRMEALLNALPDAPQLRLHVMGHGRDEQVIRQMSRRPVQFHAYPREGPYRLEDLEAPALDALRSIGFLQLIYLDAGTHGAGLEGVCRLLEALDGRRLVSFRADGRFCRVVPARRDAARTALDRVLEWYLQRIVGD
jgi:hypothetical protein